MAGTFSATRDRIRAKRTDIWDREPHEIGVLMRTQFPYSGTFTAVMYAYAEIYHLSRNLFFYRGMMHNEAIGLREVKILLPALLLSVSKRYSTWKLVESANVLEEAARAIQTEEMPGLLEIVDELLIYNNKLLVWLDSRVAWFKCGKECDFTVES